MKINMPKEWLKASSDDLQIISRIIDIADLSHMIAFHSQQSIEKSFESLAEIIICGITTLIVYFGLLFAGQKMRKFN